MIVRKILDSYLDIIIGECKEEYVWIKLIDYKLDMYHNVIVIGLNEDNEKIEVFTGLKALDFAEIGYDLDDLIHDLYFNA